MKKPLVPVFGMALVLLVILLRSTPPDFRTVTDPVMTTDGMQAELERLHQINLIVGSGDFDLSVYPVSVGIDARNGKMLIENVSAGTSVRMWAWCSWCTRAWAR